MAWRLHLRSRAIIALLLRTRMNLRGDQRRPIEVGHSLPTASSIALDQRGSGGRGAFGSPTSITRIDAMPMTHPHTPGPVRNLDACESPSMPCFVPLGALPGDAMTESCRRGARSLSQG